MNFLKSEYKCIIPCDIYQTWYTKDLPEKMRERVNLLKSQNPNFNHYLFDDNDCFDFIKAHFDKSVINAFESLVPGQYKCDLWRYCVLYIHGGIYMDIKMKCVNGFKLIALTEKEHFVQELDVIDYGVYNSLNSNFNLIKSSKSVL
jgi:mannosyltransferase OCH1-like enzyme